MASDGFPSLPFTLGFGGPGNWACRHAHDCSTGVAVCAPSVGASEIASHEGVSVWAGVGGASEQYRQDEADRRPRFVRAWRSP
jgi:hypothetical protein